MTRESLVINNRYNVNSTAINHVLIAETPAGSPVVVVQFSNEATYHFYVTDNVSDEFEAICARNEQDGFESVGQSYNRLINRQFGYQMQEFSY